MKLYDDTLIVVTGGAGFIGSCVIKELNDQGLDNILVVDDLGTSETWKNLVGKRFVDIIRKDKLLEFLDGREDEIEAFIHLGACSNTLELDADYLLENNYRYSVRLCEYAVHHGIRFVYASSAATYGDGSRGFSDSPDLLQTLEPLNMYGYSKHLFDLWLLNQGLLSEVVGLKYFNVFGPNEYHKGRMSSAIVRMVPEYQKTGAIRLFKSEFPEQFPDGEQKRDFIYVKDAARMTIAFLKSNCTGIYNVGSGQAISWNRMASAVCSSLGCPTNITYIDMPNDLLGKYQYFTQADMTKAKKVLGEKADCASFENSVHDYVTNYLLEKKLW